MYQFAKKKKPYFSHFLNPKMAYYAHTLLHLAAFT